MGELSQSAPIPPGFCITTEGYLNFLQTDNLAEKTSTALAKLNVANSAQEIELIIRDLFSNSELSEDLKREIITAVDRLDPNAYYAIRSSATSEDLAEASFAGQLETFLNIRGYEAILEHVKKCWASLFTERVIIYRETNHIPQEDLKIAVVVQKMVFSEKSGIMFTADPLSGNRNHISINAGFGLGESLVSGLVNADLFAINKIDWNIVNKTISQKLVGIFPIKSETGGVVQRDIDPPQQSISSLSDAEIFTLAKLGQQIEDHYGSPQDIEWAIEGTEFFITQSRPITTLYPLPLPYDGIPRIFLNFNYIQVMMDPIRPLGISVLRCMLIREIERHDDNCNIMYPAGGRLYVELSKILSVKKISKGIPNVLGYIVGQSISSALNKAITKLEPKIRRSLGSRFGLIHSLSRVFPIMLRALYFIIFRNPEKTFQRGVDYLDTIVDEFTDQLLNAPLTIETIYLIEEILHQVLLHKIIKAASLILGGVLPYRILSKFAIKKNLESEFEDIAKGLDGNITTQMDLAVASLTDLKIKAEESGDDNLFQNALSEFLQKFGMRGMSEIDITRDRYSESPDALLKIIEGNRYEKEHGDHNKHHQDLSSNQQAATERFIQAFKGPKRHFVKRLLRLFTNIMPFREHPKYAIIRVFWVVKQKLLDFGAHLQQSGVIATSKDIYYLNLPEIESAVQSLSSPSNSNKTSESPSIRELISSRKKDYLGYAKARSPTVMTDDGEIMVPDPPSGDFPDGAIVGGPVSAGEVEGIAHVISDPTQEVLQKGEILVTSFTDPGWTPLFINAAALVMEVGGMMTHGSVVAREYGIPAIVGVPDATKRIKTGQKIRVNGNLGYIEILSSEEL